MRIAAWSQSGDESVRSGVHRFFLFAERRLGPLSLLALVVVVVLTYTNWEWLQTTPVARESGSTTIRNLSLVIAALVALPIAIWRSRSAELQANTAQRELSNRLYQQGTEMLQSLDLSVRLDGIYTLQRLAEDEPARYHVQVMSRLCAFVRHPAESEEREEAEAGNGGETNQNLESSRVPEDVQAAIMAISTCHARQLEVERGAGFRLNLRGARLAHAELMATNLSSANLHNANLANATLVSADLSEARLVQSDLSNADLTEADLTCTSLVGAKLHCAHLDNAILVSAQLNNATLSGTTLAGSDLSGANLFQAKLSRAQLSPETRLTQTQLRQARADSDNPPFLDGAIDTETGEPLVWRGKPLDGQT